MWAVEFRAKATEDIESASQWYDQQRTGLGRDFLLQVDAAIDLLLQNPKIHAVVGLREVRAMRLKRFPYVIYYRCDATRIEIIGCLHFSRHPSAWRGRLN